MSKRLSKYISFCPVRGAYKFNALSMSWYNLDHYLHPAVNQILKALAKIERDKEQAIITKPEWKGQVWP
ncbi:MAG: hypothetical protein EZS28_010960, partial [Streblomastix strix]